MWRFISGVLVGVVLGGLARFIFGYIMWAIILEFISVLIGINFVSPALVLLVYGINSIFRRKGRRRIRRF